MLPRAQIPLKAKGLAAAALLALVACGCTGPAEYFRNGLKVGPNYCCPAAPVEEHWIDAKDDRLRAEPTDLVRWWDVFHDPVLNQLVDCACKQNLTLREAGFRILQARAQLQIARGDFFPQVQNATVGYQKSVNSGANPQVYNVTGAVAGGFQPNGGAFQPGTFVGSGPLELIPPATTEGTNIGFNLSWELDFWGRFRRAVTAAEETLQANCADYNGAMVSLLGDVASNYVQYRTDQKRIELVRANLALQQRVLDIAQKRFQEGQTNDLDLNQARSNLAQTEAQIPLLLVEMRTAEIRLCVLMGMPPADIEAKLGEAPIPAAPSGVAVGIPADLLRRRPDVVRAERLAAAQAEQIGIAEADYYPAFKINGDMGYTAAGVSQLFESNAFYGSVNPGIQWNLLNYGRIRSNVCLQDAHFQQLVTVYQRTVLQAAEEAENGLSQYVHQQDRARLLDASVSSLQLAVATVVKQYSEGGIDFTRVSQIEQDLVVQQDAQAAARGQVSQGLINVYRALGGGWQIAPCDGLPPAIATPDGTAPAGARLNTGKLQDAPAPNPPTRQEQIPKPLPDPPKAVDRHEGTAEAVGK